MLPDTPGVERDVARELIGQVVAERYAIEALLGTGGMGVVYRARHVHMRKTVALKVLHREMTYLPEVVARFEREAVAAAHISHPNVTAATDFGRLEDGSFYLVLEYVAGRSLRDLLAHHGRLPPARATHIARQIAEALDAAHAAGVVHRDLKPDNVMLVERGEDADFVKVLDFGIAKLSRADTSGAPALTQLGSVFGTPEYMSPEQAMGTPVDHRSDLYALGIIFYEMLAGATPFAHEDSMAVLTRHMTQPPPPLASDVPAALAATVLALLGKRPHERPESAARVAADLALHEGTLGGPSAGGPPPSSWAMVPPSSLPLGGAALSAPAMTSPAATAADRPLSPSTFPLPRTLEEAKALLRQELVVGSLRVPVPWALASLGGAMLVTFVLVAVLVAAPGRRPPAPTTAPVPSDSAPLVSAPPPATTTTEEERDQARKAVATVERKAVYERTDEDWVVLGGAHFALGAYADCVSAYRNAISKRRALATDPTVLAHLRRAAADEDAANKVITLAETTLLRHGTGVDLLFQIWLDTRDDAATQPIAERCLKKLVILSRRGSEAVRIAVELNTTERCDKLLDAVTRAATDADARALPRLRELERRDGCGGRDCFPCLRDGDVLARAVRRATQRPAPTFDAPP